MSGAASRAETLVKALFSRRWWWVTLLVLALMTVLARLGFWQLDRLAERRAANVHLAAALASAPIPLNAQVADYATLAPEAVGEELANRDVRVIGSYDFSEQRILKLQNWNGRPGVHLVTPLVLDGGDAGNPAAILVDRGWIPDAEYAAGQMFDDPEEPSTVEGYIALTETLSRRTAESVVPVSPENEIFRVDIASLQAEMPYSLVPFYIMAAPPAGQDDTLPLEIAKEIDLSEGPHLGYAVQWFIFALGLGAGYVVYVNHSLDAKVAAVGNELPHQTRSEH